MNTAESLRVLETSKCWTCRISSNFKGVVTAVENIYLVMVYYTATVPEKRAMIRDDFEVIQCHMNTSICRHCYQGA
jgi:hypothetical protein